MKLHQGPMMYRNNIESYDSQIGDKNHLGSNSEHISHMNDANRVNWQ